MATEKITHFTHPNHTLNAITSGNFKCDGCKLTGSSKRFSCDTCDFNLHDHCARAPATLSSFMDPHPLRLITRKRFVHYCDVCGNRVKRMSYHCGDCSFDAHPGCTYYPEYIELGVDAKHYLRLRMERTPLHCNICHEMCNDMRYTCRTCNVDVHVQCIAGWKPLSEEAAAAARDGGGGGGDDGSRGGSRGNVGNRGGDGDDDDDLFIGVLKKVTWNITKLAVEATIGIPLPDLD